MNRDELIPIFENNYNSTIWKSLLSNLFPQREFFATPEEVKQEGSQRHQIAKSIKRFGQCQLRDKAVVAFYEAELIAGRNVTRNRVGLRNLLHTDVIPGDVDAILIVYYNPSARDWRVSLISKSLSWDEESQMVRTETHPKRYTFVLGETETVRTAVERFASLLKSLAAGDALELEDLLKAFSVEKISNEFFKEYRHHFERFEEYLVDSQYFEHFLKQARGESQTDRKEEAERLARNFAKKLLGRIVFLYFLQKKGWLGVPKEKPWGHGEKEFLSQLFKDFENKSDFYTSCLVPLFFETLNNPTRQADIFPITGTKIPYLNGGLFDRDPIEPVDVKFKQSLFVDLFEFFDRYNFTIDENSPEDQDIGIDPEMLGLIFENLLEDNRTKGTYYTPKEVVHYMCKESLRLHIHNTLQKQATDNELREIDAFITQMDKVDLKVIEKHSKDIEQTISRVKICDPAIGSGAFPMGMVYEILRLKQALPGKKHFDYSEEKFRIIQDSIYGVDIDQGAVDIARLRFWLALIVDEDEPKPLPNLDYKIMQGDSLKEEFEGIPLDRLTEPDVTLVEPKPRLDLGEEFEPPQKTISFTTDEKARLKSLVKEYYNVHDEETKKRLHDRIDKFIHNELTRIVEIEKAQKQRLIDETKRKLDAKLKSLSENARERYRQTSNEAKTIARLEKDLKLVEKKEKALHEVQECHEKPYFLWHLFFHNVLVEKEGFDIVIANPPYGVRVEDSLKTAYGLISKDSYGVFTSMALQKLVKPGGMLCFIISDTWLTIKSHFELRKQVLKWQLCKVIRLHSDCFRATVNACILTVAKSPTLEKQPKVFAADFTNLSTRKDVASFRDKLYRLEGLAGQATPQFAVYGYDQSLLHINSNLPIIVGNPKLYQLMNNEITQYTHNESKKNDLEVRKVILNGTPLLMTKLGATYIRESSKKQWKNDGVFKIISGIKTGNNKKYIYKAASIGGDYRQLDNRLLLTEQDIENLSGHEKLNGIKRITSSLNFIAPLDKGGESDTDNSWLPNYYVPTNYFIDWSEKAVKGMYSEPHSDMANVEFRFVRGLTYSRTGIYAPTFRLNSGGILESKSCGLFTSNADLFCMLGLLCSKLFRYLVKNYIMHTVETSVGTIGGVPIPINNVLKFEEKLSELVRRIIENQKQNLRYNYIANEQKQIDRLVYQLYGLNDEDINEVETWFARRYPKLAKYAYIKPPEEFKKPALGNDEYMEGLKALIAGPENKQVEFKSTLRYCLKQKSPQTYVEHTAMKNIVAFLNSEGGTLFLGIDDDSVLLGLDHDFGTFKESNKQDAFQKHLDNLVSNYMGDIYSRYLNIDFPTLDGKQICVLEVKEKAAEPVFLINKKKGNEEEFYVRRFASTVALTPRETLQYVKEHWK